MYAYRYNPVFDRWVLTGPPVLPVEKIGQAHLIKNRASRDFLAASFPRSILELDLPSKKAFQSEHHDLLHLDHPAVGEYELLLYQGKVDFWEWDVAHWEKWLGLVQERIRQSYQNLRVKHCHFELRTSLLYSLESYLRLGDLITSSHPVFGNEPKMTADLVEKLQKEELFTIYRGEKGWLYAPSAPMQEKELWYLPYSAERGVEVMGESARKEVVKVVRHILRRLHDEWPNEHYVVKVHTQIKSQDDDLCWWLQIYQEKLSNEILPVHPLPEGFVYILHKMLGRI